jgi:hypothetical protein
MASHQGAHPSLARREGEAQSCSGNHRPRFSFLELYGGLYERYEPAIGLKIRPSEEI